MALYDDAKQIEPIAERLAERSMRAADGCLVWTGYKNEWGYGYLGMGKQKVRAHRAAYEQANGRKLRPDQIVCHKCDNPACIEPTHLYTCTPLQNSQDRSGTPAHWAEQVAQSRCLRASSACRKWRIPRADR